MRCDQSGHIIQVKEENKIPFYSPNCCEINDNIENAWPIRCEGHNKELKKWQRIKNTRRKFKKKFKKDRHRFIKMLTFGLPGNKITRNVATNVVKKKTGSFNDSFGKVNTYNWEQQYEYTDDHKLWRNELRKRFNKLRRDPWWKKHVDGGIWFYETKLTDIDSKVQMTFDGEEREMNDIRMKIHPHFHCMILGPRNLAGTNKEILEKGYFHELDKLFEKHGLGKPNVTGNKSKNGRTINASLNKSLWYLTNLNLLYVHHLYQ